METRTASPVLEADPPRPVPDRPADGEPGTPENGSLDGTVLRSVIRDALGPAPARFLRDARQAHGE